MKLPVYCSTKLLEKTYSTKYNENFRFFSITFTRIDDFTLNSDDNK